MSIPIKQHYVAQHVLRRFCDSEGMLWGYDKERKRIYRGPTPSQASEKHFYSFKGGDGKKTTVIELKFLRKIDAGGCIAIQRLLNRETLTTDQAINFMRFAAAQMIRVESHFQRLHAMLTPLLRESANRMFKYDEEFKKRVTQRLLAKGIPQEEIEALMARLAEGKTKVTANRGFIVSTFLRNLDSITKEFCQMKWRFLRTDSTTNVFVLSDNPLVLTDVGEGPPQPLGIRNPNIEITMPLSPTTVAIARWNGPYGYGIINKDYISVVNGRTIEQAHRFVYAPYQSDELLQKVVASQGKQARVRVKKIRQGEATVMMNILS
jgi:Protein of unknown function (DUF4238)